MVPGPGRILQAVPARIHPDPGPTGHGRLRHRFRHPPPDGTGCGLGRRLRGRRFPRGDALRRAPFRTARPGPARLPVPRRPRRPARDRAARRLDPRRARGGGLRRERLAARRRDPAAAGAEHHRGVGRFAARRPGARPGHRGARLDGLVRVDHRRIGVDEACQDPAPARIRAEQGDHALAGVLDPRARDGQDRNDRRPCCRSRRRAVERTGPAARWRCGGRHRRGTRGARRGPRRRSHLPRGNISVRR